MLSISAARTLTLFIGLAAGLLATSFAQAHLTLIESKPAAETTVTTPSQVDLIFNKILVPRASRLELTLVKDGAAPVRVEHFDTEILNDGRTLRAKLHHSLEAGNYRVQWRAVGADNHPMIGEYGFTVK